MQACSVAEKRLLEHTPQRAQGPPAESEKRGQRSVWRRREPEHSHLPRLCGGRVWCTAAAGFPLSERRGGRGRPCMGKGVCRVRGKVEDSSKTRKRLHLCMEQGSLQASNNTTTQNRTTATTTVTTIITVTRCHHNLFFFFVCLF